MEVISGLIVVVVFMVITAIAVGAVGERYDRRTNNKTEAQ